MTDTVAGLWAALDQMAEEPQKTYVAIDGSTKPVRREIILITDGRPHCKRDGDTQCQPCSPVWRDETLQKLAEADAVVKMIWRGDRQTHDGSIDVDEEFLQDSEVFGCLDIKWESDNDFVLIENFDDPEFVRALRGSTTCVQLQQGN